MAESSWTSYELEVLHTDDFSGQRLNRPGVYVVCFGATWCPITRRFMPKFVAERGKLPETLAIADITDVEDPLWETFRIKITPTILVFRDGVEQLRVDGRRFLGIKKSDLTKLERDLEAG